MIYRKQKRWIEFVLRLFPLLALLFFIIINIFSFNQTGVLPDNMLNLNEFIISIIGEFNDTVFNLSEMTGVSNALYFIQVWVVDNIGDNILLIFIINILSYQLLLSLILLLFDFLSFIIDFARKWLDGLYGKER